MATREDFSSSIIFLRRFSCNAIPAFIENSFLSSSFSVMLRFFLLPACGNIRLTFWILYRRVIHLRHHSSFSIPNAYLFPLSFPSSLCVLLFSLTLFSHQYPHTNIAYLTSIAGERQYFSYPCLEKCKNMALS